MPDFCSWLSKIAKKEPQYFYAHVYDNSDAASLLKVMQEGNDTPEQDTQYDPHFIITYTKSPKVNECTISYKGVDDPHPITMNF
ncbi:MAG TPA: hypothetical protein VLF63_00530 [Patescibacteria group bacterium]|nr:hypothetical protein [Patescibacteria group bacterium]